MGHPQTIADLFQAYAGYLAQQGKQNIIPNLQHALLHFTLPGWGGPVSKGNKATAQETQDGLEFLQQVPSEQLLNALAVQEQVFEQLKTEKSRRRQPRHYLKKFVDWALDSGYIKPVESEPSKPETYFFRSPNGKPKHKKLPKLTNRTREEPYGLMAVQGDYVNSKLQQQLDEIQEFARTRLNCRSKVSVEHTTTRALLLMGWLHRAKNISLEELHLNLLVPNSVAPLQGEVINLNPKIDDFENPNDYWIAKLKAQEAADEVGKNAVELLKEFFGWRAKSYELDPSTHVGYIKALIAIAKYLYRDETDRGRANNYEDVPVVKRLQVYQAELSREDQETPNVVAYEEVSVPWETALEVVERLRQESDMETHVYYNPTSGNRQIVRREKAGVAGSLQDFLMIGLLVLIPPDRSRTIRELRLSQTLKHGIFKSGSFTPAQAMSEPSSAIWYIHLQRDQYKTGRFYGEWCGAIPNIEFNDGKTFYEYLERWFYRGYQDEQGNWHGYVEALPRLDHDFAFTSSRSGKALDKASFSGYVQRTFWRLVGVRVRPQSLRHMLCTFIKDVQASEAEKESISLWMKHSREMQSKHYSHQEQGRALQPALDFMVRVNSQILKDFDKGNDATLNDLTKASQPDKIGAAAPRYGQQLVGEKLVDHPEEQKIIELIRRHRKSGKSLKKIADWLNEQGYPTRHGCKWQAGQIKRIVDRLNLAKS